MNVLVKICFVVSLILCASAEGSKKNGFQALFGARGRRRHQSLGSLVLQSLIAPKTASVKGKKGSSKSCTGNKSAKASKKRVTLADLTAEELESIDKKQKMFLNIQQMATSIVSIFGTRWIMKLDYKNPATIQLGRICFAAYLVVAQLLKLLLKYIIKKDGDKDIVKPKAGLFGMEIPGMTNNPIMQMMSGMGANKKTDVPLTVEQYDLHAIRELFNGLVLNVIIVSVFHLLFKRHSTLFIIPFMGLQNWVKAPIILIRLFGFKPVGQLARPFKNQIELMLEGLKPPAEEGVPAITADADAEPVLTEPPSISVTEETFVIKESEEEEEANDEQEEEVEEGSDEEEEGDDEEEEEEESDNGSSGNTLSNTKNKESEVKVNLVAESGGVKAATKSDSSEDIGDAISDMVSEAAEKMEELIHKLEAEEPSIKQIEEETEEAEEDDSSEESATEE